MVSSTLGRTLSKSVRYLFSGRTLLLTNTCCSCTLLGLGDFVQQTIGIRVNRTRTEYDWRRTGRFATMGLVIGPMTHYWYVFLDGFLPGKSLRTVFKKIACDQISCPVFSSVYVTGLGVLEGQSLSAAFAEYRSKFIAIYTLDWFVWPPCQFINFLFLPPQARVVYIGCIQTFYNSCMSYIKHEVKTPITASTTVIVGGASVTPPASPGAPTASAFPRLGATTPPAIDWARL